MSGGKLLFQWKVFILLALFQLNISLINGAPKDYQTNSDTITPSNPLNRKLLEEQVQMTVAKCTELKKQLVKEASTEKIKQLWHERHELIKAIDQFTDQNDLVALSKTATTEIDELLQMYPLLNEKFHETLQRSQSLNEKIDSTTSNGMDELHELLQIYQSINTIIEETLQKTKFVNEKIKQFWTNLDQFKQQQFETEETKKWIKKLLHDPVMPEVESQGSTEAESQGSGGEDIVALTNQAIDGIKQIWRESQQLNKNIDETLEKSKALNQEIQHFWTNFKQSQQTNGHKRTKSKKVRGISNNIQSQSKKTISSKQKNRKSIERQVQAALSKAEHLKQQLVEEASNEKLKQLHRERKNLIDAVNQLDQMDLIALSNAATTEINKLFQMYPVLNDKIHETLHKSQTLNEKINSLSTSFDGTDELLELLQMYQSLNKKIEETLQKSKYVNEKIQHFWATFKQFKGGETNKDTEAGGQSDLLKFNNNKN